MFIKRRSLLSGVLSAGLASRAFAQVKEDDTVGGRIDATHPQILPSTNLTGSNSHYARFALPGPFGLPRKAIEIEPKSGLRVLCYLPPGRTSARPVVFSHGELAEPRVYDPLLMHWASHGFGVLAPVHDDSIIESGLKARRFNVEGSEWDLTSLLEDAKAWESRTTACRAVLDLIPILEASSAYKFPSERPLIAGHGFGAYTSQLLLGAEPRLTDGKIMSAVDPRFYAGLLLSPQGHGVLGLNEHSWDNMNRSIMAVTGNGDTDASKQDPIKKTEPYTLSPPKNKHLAWFANITPPIFAGQGVTPNSMAQTVFLDLLAVTTAFLISYSEYDAVSFAELASDYYTRLTEKRVTMFYR